jgi:hypothetical protein
MSWAAARIAAVVLLVAPGAASAAATPSAEGTLGPVTPQVQPSTATTATDPNALTTPPSPAIPPPGHRLTARRALAIARAVPKIAAVRREHPRSYAEAYLKGATQWQVSVFSPGRDRVELGQVTIDDLTGAVLEAWTGYQVAWTMARGYDGAFGRTVNAWYVWIPLCVLFLAPFLPGPRRWRPSWLQLDLLVLVGFSVSLACFNAADVDASVPLVYPLLGYLLLRMLVAGFRRPRLEPLRLLVPVSWLAIGLVFLVGFRVGLNVTSSNVVDVGYAGVIGANRLVEGKPLYGTWPKDNAYGDTYGPVNYYAYVPFERVLGWSGTWDDLPAAHAAAIAFDLLTLLLLFLLGRRIRGPSLGIVLAYAWASYPFTLYVSNTNSNDGLVALLLVATLLAAASPLRRGALLALAGLTKFAPLALVPLLARTPVDMPLRRQLRGGSRALLSFALAFALMTALAMLPVLLGDDLRTFWDHTLAFQRERESPFSIWGLWGGLDTVQTAVQVAAVALALAVGFVPRRRTLAQVAALAAAVTIALQLGATHWFYLYLVWFFPLVMVALLARHGTAAPGSAEAGGGRQEQLLDPVGAPG